MEVAKPDNIATLRSDLSDLFAQLKAGTVEPKLAHELSNAAGKIVASVGVELKYAYQRGVQPSIPYLDTPETVTEWEAHKAKKAKKVA